MFLTGLLWLVATSLAAHLVTTLFTRLTLSPIWQPLVHASVYTALILLGFAALNWVYAQRFSIRETNLLPSRSTTTRETLTGIAFGWGLALAVVILLLITRSLQPNFWVTPRSLVLTILSLVTVAIATLGWEAAFRGYLLRRMSEATGPTAATVVLSLFYALCMTFAEPSAGILAFLTTFALGIVFSIAYQQTRALWLPWGLHFGWTATVAVLFGMPLAGDGTLSAFVTTDLYGRAPISGGGFGPEASVLTLVAALIAIPVLIRITRDFAWEYTAPTLIPAGYAMEAKPPAAHTAMEQQQQARPAPLVQILGATPTAPSTMPAVVDHLRGSDES